MLDGNGDEVQLPPLPELSESVDESETADFLFPELEGASAPTQYCQVTNRLFYRWWCEHRGSPLTEKVLEELMLLLTHSETDPTVIAPTIYHLEKAGSVFVPNLPPVKLPKSDLYHVPISNVVALLLSNSDTTKSWRYTYDESATEHPCSTEGWKEIEENLRTLKDSHKLLLLSVFIDDYRLCIFLCFLPFFLFWSNSFRQSIAQQNLLGAVVLSVVNNYGEKVQYLLTILTKGVNLQAYFEEELVPFFQKLETGM